MVWTPLGSASVTVHAPPLEVPPIAEVPPAAFTPPLPVPGFIPLLPPVLAFPAPLVDPLELDPLEVDPLELAPLELLAPLEPLLPLAAPPPGIGSPSTIPVQPIRGATIAQAARNLFTWNLS
jgi:hypothetical protein